MELSKVSDGHMHDEHSHNVSDIYLECKLHPLIFSLYEVNYFLILRTVAITTVLKITNQYFLNHIITLTVCI